MHLFLVILTLLASLVLIAVILLQNPKGGSGLTSGMSSLGTVQTLGVRRTGDFLTKLTAILAGAVMVLSFIAQFTLPSRAGGPDARESVLQKELPAAPASNLPAMPGTTEQPELPGSSK
ncbi:MAG: preprotein translocase subunit SecG [Prosthecochloris sp.]|uniref:preprotein translocase subunit SecG n=1 Tax=unclassified Prosthecochloris TaxID=2632826 RepID=UPI000DF7ACE0|nr:MULTISPECIES: preprotein translocase subunit SecG [unclassified Prosthecochloris]MCW8798683.1 preprotein translocase subunit SecG [Prosthecochloris sp.]NEX11411.1 preprotein translocase subunit SecG [Prosthecochloris sp.]RDD30625.1 preprotein translocase subunit SecG [Prosthecochloris sp. ZM]